MDWNKTFGGSGYDEGASVQQTNDGGYIITGATDSYGAGFKDVWLIKTDSKGNMDWSETFGDLGDDEGASVQQINDGGYIITGVIDSSGDRYWRDLWLIKTDSEGNMDWSKIFGGLGDDGGASVQQTNNGGYIITGATASYDAGFKDVWLVKTDSEGNIDWSETFGGSGYDEGASVQQTNDGGYILTGLTYSHGYGVSDKDVWLIKIGETAVETPQTSGFEATVIIVGLLVVYILRKRK
jgi:hypothetical protein